MSSRKHKKTSTADFRKLEKIWYKKLAKSGFEDIEWNSSKPLASGGGQDSRYLKQGLVLPDADTYRERILYFRMAVAYLQDYQGLRKADRFIWKLHAAGATYKEVLTAYNAKYPEISTYTLYYRIERLIEKCRAWNEHNPKGVLYEPDNANE